MVHINHRYLLDLASRRKPGGRYLDFGCGQGEAVFDGLEKNYDIWGVDNFSLNPRPACDRVIATDQSDVLPFPDSHFDVIFSNQVFEHIQNQRPVLQQLRRVLKPDGLMFHLFPSLEVWREGHCQVPFAHRIRKAWYLKMMYRLGFGHERHRTDWSGYWLNYLTTSTHYLPQREIHRIWAEEGFAVDHIENDYIKYRLGIGLPMIGPFLLKRLAGVVLTASPKVS